MPWFHVTDRCSLVGQGLHVAGELAGDMFGLDPLEVPPPPDASSANQRGVAVPVEPAPVGATRLQRRPRGGAWAAERAAWGVPWRNWGPLTIGGRFLVWNWSREPSMEVVALV